MLKLIEPKFTSIFILLGLTLGWMNGYSQVTVIHHEPNMYLAEGASNVFYHIHHHYHHHDLYDTYYHYPRYGLYGIEGSHYHSMYNAEFTGYEEELD